MVTPEPVKEIGRTFEDMYIRGRKGDEYLGCKFIRCEVHQNGAVFYDCHFDSCEIVFY